MEDIIQEIISVYQSHRNPEHIMVHDFYDFDNLKDKIIIKNISFRNALYNSKIRASTKNNLKII